ncbi:MAG: nucleotidyl transferase AbiEii/AbiGii toxin family protein [Candidatus Omnitrophota bacterium]
MNFEAVFKLLTEEFKKNNIRFALIGGFALHAAGFTRATKDIDFLVAKADMEKVKKIMESFGYELIHESEDISNFLGKMKELGKIDFLHAHRKYAKEMLERAQDKEILSGRFRIKVIKAEDLIGLKVQSSSNDPGRYHQDMADIQSLIRINYKNLDMRLIKEYFDLFERGEELKGLLEKIKDDE